MIDVARSFKPKEWIFELIDVMAIYKLNKLHLHLSDDGAWRLQIPSLPELTEVQRFANLVCAPCLQEEIFIFTITDVTGRKLTAKCLHIGYFIIKYYHMFSPVEFWNLFW